MITDARVIHLADRTWLDVPASLAEGLHAKLDSLLFAEDAAVANDAATLAIIEAHGPLATEVVADARIAIAEYALATVRHDAYDIPGMTIVTATSNADAVVAELIARGAAETTLATLDIIRVEAGRPAFLIDMDEHTIPLEAGIETRAVSFTKGCYVGQEVIVRVMHRGGGRVAKKLVGLQLSSSEVPSPGSAIRAEGREIGRVTSAVWSPAMQRSIAMGYVHRDFVSPNTTVGIVHGEQELGAVVATLPFLGVTAAAADPH
jgi:folate-binding protein YgfZ